MDKKWETIHSRIPYPGKMSEKWIKIFKSKSTYKI